MGSSMMRRVFDQSTEAFNRHDIEAMKALFTDDVTCTAPGNVKLRGRDAVGAFYQSWMEGFPDGRVDLSDVETLDAGIVEEGTFSGTHRGVLRSATGDIPPTGRALRARYIQVVRMRGDQICAFDLVYDRLDLVEQLGLTAATGAANRQGAGASASMD